MNFEPFGMNVLIKKFKEETKSAGGIIIPNKEEETIPGQGIVEQVGPKCKDAKIGDHVYFGAFSGSSLKDGKDHYVVLDEDEIYGRMLS